MPTGLEHLSDEELIRMAGLPTSIPDKYDDPSLTPLLAKDDSRKLEEYRTRYAAKMLGVDPHLAAAVAMQESGFNPNAVSPTGVKGTMQLTKATGNSYGYNRDIPDENILGGITHLKKGGLQGYPDPNDYPQWSKSVNSLAEKSKSMAPNIDYSSMSDEELMQIAGVSGGENNNVQEESTLGKLLNQAGTLGRKFTQSTTAGISEPLAAAGSAAIEKLFPNEAQRELNKDKSFSDLYSENRAGLKESLAGQEEEFPITSTVGDILGFISPGGAYNQIGKVTSKALSKAPALVSATGNGLNLGGRMLSSGGEMAAYQALHPDQDVDPALVGMAAGIPLAGKVIGTVGTGTRRVGRGLLNKSLGVTKKEVGKTGNLAEDLIERKAPVFGLEKKAADEVTANENKLQELLASKKDIINKQNIIDELDNAVGDAALLPEASQPTYIAKIQEIKNEILNNPAYDQMSISDLNKVKRALYKNIGDAGYLKDSKTVLEADKAFGRGMRKEIERIAPDARGINKELGTWGKTQRKLAERANKLEAGQNIGGIVARGGRDLTGAGLGFVIGGGVPGAVIGTAASEALNTLPGSVAAAKGLNKLGSLMEYIGKASENVGNVSKLPVSRSDVPLGNVQSYIPEEKIQLPEGKIILDREIPILSGKELPSVESALGSIIEQPNIIGSGKGINLDDLIAMENAIQEANTASKIITKAGPKASSGSIQVVPGYSGRKISEETLQNLNPEKVAQEIEFQKLFGDKYIDLAELTKRYKQNPY